MVKNVTEILVEQKLDELIKRGEDFCRCTQCREDIIAYALNNLNPHYVSTEQGDLYTKAKVLSINFDVEVTTAVAMAIKLVGENPRH